MNKLGFIFNELVEVSIQIFFAHSEREKIEAHYKQGSSAKIHLVLSS